MADPFDFSTSDPTAQGFLGQTPAFWRDLASFGGNLAASANQRTGSGFLANGTSFAGALGPAISATMQQGRQNAMDRGTLAQQQAQTQGLQITNAVNASGLPAAIAHNQFMANIWQHPEQAQAILRQFSPSSPGLPSIPGLSPQASSSGGSQNTAPQDSDTLANSNVPTDFAGAIRSIEAPKMGASPLNKQGFLGNYQFGTAALADAGIYQPAPGENLKTNEWKGQIVLPGQQPMTAQQFAQSPEAQDTAFATHMTNLGQKAKQLGLDQYIGQTVGGAPVTQETLAGLMHFAGPEGAQEYLSSGGKADVADANGTKRSAYMKLVAQRMGAGQPQQPYQVASTTPVAPPTGQQQPVQMAPGAVAQAGAPAGAFSQQAYSAAANLMNQARDLRTAQSLGLPVFGDPKALEDSAQKLLSGAIAGPQAGSEAAAKLPYLPFDLRPGGMGYRADMGWVKNPQLEETISPATGVSNYVHITPPLPGSPPGTPGESTPVLDASGKPVVKALSPNLQAARTKAYEDFASKDTDAFIAAQNTHQWLEQMNHSADTLNANGGFVGTGPTAPARLAFANNVNDILRTAGLPTAFDPNSLAAWEELKKATTTAGFELSSHYEGHARQAAQTIMNATAAVPSERNTPVGFHLVSNGIQEAAQQAIDLHNYKQQTYDQGGDLNAAEVDFYKRVAPQMYARRAISGVTPYNVGSDKELNRYLPGTFLNYKGKIVQVPEREGSPPIPEYLKNAQPPATQQ